jgi:DNA invertase Pin-like site-specific DNA recombinase
MGSARRPAAKRRNPADLTGARVGLYCRVSLDDRSTEKSVGDQEAEGRAWVARVGARLDERHVYRDNSLPASRFTKKERPAYGQLLAAITAGKLDAVWVWAQNRGTRRVSVASELVDLFRDRDVLLVIGGRVCDLHDPADVMQIHIQAAVDQKYVDDLSRDVTRGKKRSAEAGRPAGSIPYGYRRVWEPTPKGQVWLRDEEHPDEAPIVREIFDRLAAGASIELIRKDLTDRGVPAKQGGRWTGGSVRAIALAPRYIGQRVYRITDHYSSRQGDRSKAVLQGVTAQWPALVDEETFWRVHRILTDPRRHSGGPRLGPRTGRYLLSALALCDVCGRPLARRRSAVNNERTEFQAVYECRDRGCVSVPAVDLDAVVSRGVIGWLSDPTVAAELSERDDEPSEARQARADAEKARAQLQRLLADVEAGDDELDPRVVSAEARRLDAAIADAERREQEASLPPVLLGLIGQRQAADAWDALDVTAKRLIIREIAEIRVLAVGRGFYRVPVDERVVWRWKLGEGEQPSGVKRVCAGCGGPIAPGHWSMYCSDDCKTATGLERRRIQRERLAAERPPAVCAECGDEFVLTRSDRRFCSKKCAAATRRRS